MKGVSMKKNIILIMTMICLIFLSACNFSIQPNYTDSNFNPASSCTTTKGCYTILNHYNMGGQDPVLVHVYAVNGSNVVYESLGGLRSSFSNVVADSESSFGVREINMYIPKCDASVVYPKPPSNQLTSKIGYIVTGRTGSPSEGEFSVNDVVFGNGWTIMNQISPGQ